MTTVVTPVLRPDHAVRVIAAPGDGVGFWAGAPSAVRVDGVWWLAYRIRVPDDAGRGLAVRLARSADGLTFETVAEIGRERFGVASLERPALVPLPGGGWRLLLSCATRETAHWRIDSLEADDVQGLPSGRRRAVLTGDAATGVKDPVVRIGPGGWRMWVCCHPLAEPAQTDRMTTRLYTSADGLVWDAGRTVLAPREARRLRARRRTDVPFTVRTHGGRMDAPAAVGAQLDPDSWDRRGTRLTAVLLGGPHEPTLALYDGRASAEENWLERTGVALLTRDGRFITTGDRPVGESPYGGGTLRYASAVPLGQRRYRLYYEAARPDGAHDLYTQAVHLILQPSRAQHEATERLDELQRDSGLPVPSTAPAPRVAPHSGLPSTTSVERRQPPEGGSFEYGPVHRGGPPLRYLVGELPHCVRLDTEVSLILSIAEESSLEPGLPATPLAAVLQGAEASEVTLIVRTAASLEPRGDVQQTLMVPVDGNSSPVRFAFRAVGVGLAWIRVTAWLGGTFLGELRLEVSVESDQPVAGVQRRRSPVGIMRADPGEVTLQVHFDGTRHTFQLLSHGYLSSHVVAKSLTERPGEAIERTIAMLRKFAGEVSGYTPSMAARWVRETGTGLWRALIPEVIQDEFWQLRDNITSFNIACEDDAVPWELLYPLSQSNDAGFLIEQFPVMRRIYDQRRCGRVLLGDASFVVPPGAPSDAQDEIASIRALLHGSEGNGPISDLSELLALLDTGTSGAVHFACHNTFSLDAGGSSINMGGGAFVPLLLNSLVAQRRLAQRNPLIFVNACRSAGVAPQYTQMMGWASQFMAAGAGAFIGTLWPVRSSQARHFAEAFYSRMAAGQELGHAVLTARRMTKDDGDPTWLAYSAYGDSTAECTINHL